jgi:hypothetical protein
MIASRVPVLARAGAATAATAIALAGAALTSTAADATVHHGPKLSTSLSVRLVKHTKDGFDVVRGQLRSHHVPLRNKTVLLESRTATTTFAVVDQARTGAHGVAAFKVALPAETTKYKLVFAPHPNFRASHSGVVTIRIGSTTPPPPVALPTSLSIRLVKHPAKGVDNISGQLRSHHVGLAGKTVELESRTASTSFAVIDSGTTGAHGVVAFKEATPTETTHYRLVFEALPNFKASHSGVVTVRIATTPPPAEPTSLSIRLVKHPAKGVDNINGQLRSHHDGVAGQTVLLESRVNGSTSFAVVDSGTTGAHGVVAFQEATPTATTHYKLVFEATPAFKASHSGVVTVRIAPAA